MSLSAASASVASPSFIAATPAPTTTTTEQQQAEIGADNSENDNHQHSNNKSTTQRRRRSNTTVHAASAASEEARLHSLIQNALLRNGSRSASTAVFYASILHARQEAKNNGAVSAPDTTLLYARALAGNGEFRRAVLLLERKGMLLGRNYNSLHQDHFLN